MVECVNRSEELRNRAFNVLGKKHGNVAGCLRLTAFALECHTMKDVGETIWH